MMMYAAMGCMMPSSERYEEAQKQLTSEELAEIERVRKAKALQRKKNQGLKEWSIDGVKVVALNKKNAVRKANRIKELINKI